MATSQGRESVRYGVNIVVMGETGVGKSTLINGLVGEDVMPTGRCARLVTQTVTEYKVRRGNVRIFDTPGFFNRKISIEAIVQDVAKKTRGKIDLLVYCVGRMHDRIMPNTTQGIGYVAHMLHSRYTSALSWDNVLYVLTYANICELNIRMSLEDNLSGQGEQEVELSERVEKMFAERYQDLRKAIHEDTQEIILEKHQIKPIDAAKIAGDIPVVTAGFCNAAIPGCDDWVSHLWRVAHSRVDAAAGPAFIGATAFHRLQYGGPDRSEKLPADRNVQLGEGLDRSMDAARSTGGTRPVLQRIREAMWGEEALQERVKEAERERMEERRYAQNRVGEAELRAMYLQTQLARSEKTREVAEKRTKVAERRVVEVERRMQELQNDLAEAERQRRAAEEGREAAEEGREAADRRAGEAEARTAVAEEEMRELETRFAHAEEERTEAERRARELVQRAEEQANEAERGRREAERGREGAERGKEEAERRAGQVENERIQAEQQRRETERGRREAEERAEALRGGEEEEPSWVVRREEIQLTDEELGRGGWGVVKVAEFRGLQVAAKCLHEQIITNYNRRLFTREMNVAARIRHPNLLQLVGATIRGELIILTELMPTSLRAILKQVERVPLTPAQCLSISLDVATALNYLHLMRPNPILHRDISSANVLLEPVPNDSWKAKVSDYGSANFLQQLRTANPGSPVYCAPEASDPTRQSPKMDIFSFGVLLVEVYTATFPDPSDREDLIQSIRDERVVRLIRQCTSEDMTRRPSASEVIAQLRQLNHDLTTSSIPETVHEQRTVDSL